MGQHAHSANDQARAQNGRWVQEVRPEDPTVDLASSQVSWESIATPTEDQMIRAADHARRGLSWNGRQLTRAELNERTDQIARQLAEQEAAYEAWKAGEEHPDDALYADIWAGNAPGTSEEAAKITLDALNARYDEIEASGDADPAELQSLDESFALYQEAILSGGRNLSINQSNVIRTNRIRLRVPF